MGIHYKPTKSLLDDAVRVDLDADMTQELNYAPPPTGGNNGAADDAAGDVAGGGRCGGCVGMQRVQYQVTGTKWTC